MNEIQLTLLDITKELFPMDLPAEGLFFGDPILMREKIQHFEDLLLGEEDGVVQIETSHRWTEGLYMRQIFIPKGTFVVGRIHRHSCMSIMSLGDKTTLTEEGVKRLRAPFSCVSRAGLKRVGYAHEDSIWTTVHATNERDLEKLESDLFVDNYSDLIPKELDFQSSVTMEGKLCRA